LVFSVGADQDNVAVLVPVVVPDELDDAPPELLELLELLDVLEPPELLELELLELELLDVLEPPELLELELLEVTLATWMVAEAGLPN
jgi:hypothetical protein